MWYKEVKRDMVNWNRKVEGRKERKVCIKP